MLLIQTSAELHDMLNSCQDLELSKPSMHAHLALIVSLFLSMILLTSASSCMWP